jgi:hypothetical protein
MTSKITISDVNVAVNKAFNAGLAGEAYEGLMPSAHDAGVHYAAAFPVGGEVQNMYLAVLIQSANDGYNNGSSANETPDPDGGIYNLQTNNLGVTPLLKQDVHSVYLEGFQAGKASKAMNWTPWLVGGGIAAAAVIAGVVVMKKTSENPTSGYGQRSKRIGVAIGKARGSSTRRDHYGIYDDGTVQYEGFEYQSETGNVVQGLPLSGAQAAHMQVHTPFKPEHFDEIHYFEKKNPVNVDYKSNDPRGWGGDPSRGAALGRPSVRGPSDFAGKLALRRIRLDSGGYDPNGTYFGTGAPLFWYASEDGEIDDMTRAANRDAAKKKILGEYPNASFFR